MSKRKKSLDQYGVWVKPRPSTEETKPSSSFADEAAPQSFAASDTAFQSVDFDSASNDAFPAPASEPVTADRQSETLQTILHEIQAIKIDINHLKADVSKLKEKVSIDDDTAFFTDEADETIALSANELDDFVSRSADTDDSAEAEDASSPADAFTVSDTADDRPSEAAEDESFSFDADEMASDDSFSFADDTADSLPDATADDAETDFGLDEAASSDSAVDSSALPTEAEEEAPFSFDTEAIDDEMDIHPSETESNDRISLDEVEFTDLETQADEDSLPDFAFDSTEAETAAAEAGDDTDTVDFSADAADFSVDEPSAEANPDDGEHTDFSPADDVSDTTGAFDDFSAEEPESEPAGDADFSLDDLDFDDDTDFSAEDLPGDGTAAAPPPAEAMDFADDLDFTIMDKEAVEAEEQADNEGFGAPLEDESIALTDDELLDVFNDHEIETETVAVEPSPETEAAEAAEAADDLPHNEPQPLPEAEAETEAAGDDAADTLTDDAADTLTDDAADTLTDDAADSLDADFPPVQLEDEEAAFDDSLLMDADNDEILELGDEAESDTVSAGDDADSVAAPAPEVSASSAPGAAASEIFASFTQEELIELLAYLDRLLDSLPEEKIREFANSSYFEIYKKVFQALGIK